MFIYQRVVIAQHQRGFLLQDQSLEEILQPGVYRCFDPLGRKSLLRHDLNQPRLDYDQVDVLIKQHAELVTAHFDLVRLGEQEIALVFHNERLAEVLAPGTRALYWKGPIDVRVEVVDIAADFALPRDRIGQIAHARGDSLPLEALENMVFAQIPDNHVGLLVVDGELAASLPPGLHGYWKFNRSIVIEQVDLRLQNLDVSGQEILTRDKVSLRVNLSAQYRVVDAVAARARLAKFAAYLYGELQFALRQAVSASDLDTLLGDKGALDARIFDTLRGRLGDYGIEIAGVGVKDIILPGEIKEILNRVVETEKAAQANVIKRREETAATRSLLNTARLMDENPTLLRLKELEVLEKVTDKVDRLTVFGGLDGVLRDTVRIGVDGG